MNADFARAVLPVVDYVLEIVDSDMMTEKSGVVQTSLNLILENARKLDEGKAKISDFNPRKGVAVTLIYWIDEVFINDKRWSDWWQQNRLIYDHMTQLGLRGDQRWDEFCNNAEEFEVRDLVMAELSWFLIQMGFRGRFGDNAHLWLKKVSEHLNNKMARLDNGKPIWPGDELPNLEPKPNDPVLLQVCPEDSSLEKTSLFAGSVCLICSTFVLVYYLIWVIGN